MESKSFCYWLQGLFELAETKELNEKQVETIKNHLKLVFLYEIDHLIQTIRLFNKYSRIFMMERTL